jgi:hypothetical protein
MQPNRTIHADWSKQPGKRWLAQATRQPNGRFLVDDLRPVGLLSGFWPNVWAGLPQDGLTVVGFDFPIGLPVAYAEQVGVADFLALLPRLGRGEWADFYRVAETAAQIGLKRPFYPYRPGGTKQQHLLDALNVDHINQLRRLCDLPGNDHSAAAPLFWTLGAQQVGKAAISGWQDLLAPALREKDTAVALWPFAGEWNDLCRPGQTIVVEAYPAAYYRPLGIKHVNKQNPVSRQAACQALLKWTAENSVAMVDWVETAVRDGFGPKPSGEDPFDALVGLLGLLKPILHGEPITAPTETAVRQIEGWIFGMEKQEHRDTQRTTA